MKIPKKCKNCIHHKIFNGVSIIDYCDYIEYYNDIGVPVPYPYFFNSDYPCRGYEIRQGVNKCNT